MTPEGRDGRWVVLFLIGLGLWPVGTWLAGRVWALRPEDLLPWVCVGGTYGNLGWVLGYWLWSRPRMGALLLDLDSRGDCSAYLLLLQAAVLVCVGLGSLLAHHVVVAVGILAACPVEALLFRAMSRSHTQLREGGIVAFPAVVPWSAIAGYEVTTWAVILRARPSWRSPCLRWRLPVLPQEGPVVEQLLTQRLSAGLGQTSWLRTGE